MIKVIPFKREHLQVIEPQDGQSIDTIPAHLYPELEQGWSFTVLDEQRRVLMCSGAVIQESGIAWGWALISRHANTRMLPLTRAVKALMPHTPAKAIRMAVKVMFGDGHRWARKLGFHLVTDEPLLLTVNGDQFMVYGRELVHGH